jgi:hypothetical protein
MALKHPTFFSAEIAAITPRSGADAFDGRSAATVPYLAPPAEETITHKEGLVLMDDMEALRLALSGGDADHDYSRSIN